VTVAFEFDRVCVEAGDAVILRGVTASIVGGAVTVLVGPSGAGKTTLLRLCNRLEVPSSGVVRFRGEDIATLDPLALRRRVGMVFQRPTLFAGSVRDNLREALPTGDDTTFVEVLERAGLNASFLDRDGGDLSGGEAQRACLARSLLPGPEVLLMDEPTSSLDQVNTKLLESNSAELVADGVTVVWVTHDLAQAERIADNMIELDGGRIVD
jgi:putative ABC transport system ATP-binding protein